MDNLLKLRKPVSRAVLKNSAIHQFVFDKFWEKVKDSEYTTSSIVSQVAKDSGLSEPWITKFIYNRGGSPSIDKLEMLYETLTGKQLIDLLK